jgi:hypothetical protein
MKAKKEKTPAEKAYVNSDKHKLGDLKLKPWTPQRMIKAQAMGMKYRDLGKDGWAQFKATNLYPGAIRDVIIFFYLSTLDPTEVEDATYGEAEAWGVKRKLHDTRTAAFWNAFTKYIQVQNEISDSATRPVETGEEEDDPNE